MNIINNKESEFFLKKGAEISGFSPFSYGVGVEILTDFGSCINRAEWVRATKLTFRAQPGHGVGGTVVWAGLRHLL